MLTEQPSKMSLGLNLFEDSACISTPLSALILMDLDSPLFLSPQATESLQLYLIRCLARSLSKRRNSNWLGSATYSICKKITYLGWISSKRIDNPSSTALLSNFTNYLSERMKSNGEISFLPIWARHDYYSHWLLFTLLWETYIGWEKFTVKRQECYDNNQYISQIFIQLSLKNKSWISEVLEDIRCTRLSRHTLYTHASWQY